MSQYDLTSRFQRVFGGIHTTGHGRAYMDSRFALGCAMSMNLVQFQSKLLMPKIFQEFGIETVGAVIVDRALRAQSLSYS
jgi:hypothetical protein